MPPPKKKGGQKRHRKRVAKDENQAAEAADAVGGRENVLSGGWLTLESMADADASTAIVPAGGSDNSTAKTLYPPAVHFADKDEASGHRRCAAYRNSHCVFCQPLVGKPGDSCFLPSGPSVVRSRPIGIEKSQLNSRCEAIIKELDSKKAANIDQLAEAFCQYGGFLNTEKLRLAELGEHQLRRSKIIAANYGKAMRANKHGDMEKFRRQSQDNERAFEVTKLEVDVLNYHLDLYKTQDMYKQLQAFGNRNAIQVGQAEHKEYVMRPDVDLPEVSLESALDEEEELKAYMKAQREEKERLKKEQKEKERAEKAAVNQ